MKQKESLIAQLVLFREPGLLGPAEESGDGEDVQGLSRGLSPFHNFPIFFLEKGLDKKDRNP